MNGFSARERERGEHSCQFDSLDVSLTEIRSRGFGNDGKENDGKDGVIKLIVNLNTIDAYVQSRVSHRPGIFNPEAVERLPLGLFLVTFRVHQFSEIALKGDFLFFMEETHLSIDSHARQNQSMFVPEILPCDICSSAVLDHPDWLHVFPRASCTIPRDAD